MKKIILGFIAYCFTIVMNVTAQSIGINSTGATPDPSALLDVDAAPGNNKGLLIPRVALTQTTLNAPIGAGIAVSLLVYNTATINDVSPGYYYWDGATWQRLNNGPGATTGNAWLLTGNAGTVAGTNFIGTTDNVPFSIRVNNQFSGRIDNTLENVFLGKLSGNATLTGTRNVAMGIRALQNITTGTLNVAIGHEALMNYTSSSSGAVGNVAIGNSALRANTTGGGNVAIGKALISNTTANNNVAVGDRALELNVGGHNNVAISNALNSCTGCTNSVAVGSSALTNAAAAISSVAVGQNALNSITTGVGVTGIGTFAEGSLATMQNATAIGNTSTVNADHKVRIGNPAVTLIEGQVAYSYPSDARFKFNVNENVPGLSFINQLRPVTYHFDTKKFDEHVAPGYADSLKAERGKYIDYNASSRILHSGFLAQEVEQVCNSIGYDFDGLHIPDSENPKDNYSIAYSQFIVPMVKAIQEQQAMILKLEKEIEELKNNKANH